MWKAGIFVFYLRVARIPFPRQSWVLFFRILPINESEWFPVQALSSLKADLALCCLCLRSPGWGWGLWALQTLPLGDFSAFPQVKQVSLCSLSGAEAGSSATWDLESLIELFAVSSFIAGNRTLSPALLGGKLFKEEKSELDNVITPIQARLIRVARRSTNHCTTDAGHGQPAVLWLRSINRPKQPQRFLTGFAFSG